MSTADYSAGHDDDDLDLTGPSWQPDPERAGYERWWDGEKLIGPSKKEPDPFSAFSPDVARSLRPGPNKDAVMARASIVAVVVAFVFQQVAAAGVISLPGLDDFGVVLLALIVAAAAAVHTGVFAVRALRRAPKLGGKGIAAVALVVAILLGLAPLLLLVAIVIGGGL